MRKKVNKNIVLLSLLQKIDKHRPEYIIKASAFYKIQNFFVSFFKETFSWYMSKMYLWVLMLVTMCEPPFIGQLSPSFLMTDI
jgi:hypothetical protein